LIGGGEVVTHNYHRYEGESDEELIYRITGDKGKLGSWQAVADVLNDLLGTEYTESKFRKQRQSFDKMLAANQSKFATDNATLNEINIARRELEKERKKLQSAKIEYNRWLRENARDEMITEQIVDAVNALEPPYIPVSRPVVSGRKEGVLVISDVHYGIEYEIKGLFGEILNAYSPEIFEDRMWKLFQKVLEIVQKEELTIIHVIELGDGIQGLLRLNSQLMKLRYGVIDSAVKYADFMANWLNELSKYVNIKAQFVKDSNHNQLRLCGAPKNSFSDENMSKVILTIIKEKLRDNSNIEIIENPTGLVFDTICGYNVLGIHGEVKNLGTAVNEFSRVYNTMINYIIGGHKHHSASDEVGMDCEAISVKSIIGIDDYSMSLNRTANAGATFLMFEEGMGKTCEYTIKLN